MFAACCAIFTDASSQHLDLILQRDLGSKFTYFLSNKLMNLTRSGSY